MITCPFLVSILEPPKLGVEKEPIMHDFNTALILKETIIFGNFVVSRTSRNKWHANLCQTFVYTSLSTSHFSLARITELRYRLWRFQGHGIRLRQWFGRKFKIVTPGGGWGLNIFMICRMRVLLQAFKGSLSSFLMMICSEFANYGT